MLNHSDLHSIPLWLKLSYTVFVGVLVPAYWRYWGAANFLWFSDIALFTTLVGIWLECPLLLSMQALSVLLPDAVWTVDLAVRLAAGRDVTGITRYMFRHDVPLVVRTLSLFHIWLPVLLIWLIANLGYDPRAWLAQSLLAAAVLVLCYLVTDRTSNINWVFGPFGKPQSRLPAPVYLLLLIGSFSLCIYLPTHRLLHWLF